MIRTLASAIRKFLIVVLASTTPSVATSATAGDEAARSFAAHALALRAAGVAGEKRAEEVLAAMPGAGMARDVPSAVLWSPFFANTVVKLGRLRSSAPTALYYNPLLDVAVVTFWEERETGYRVNTVRALPGEKLSNKKAETALLPSWMSASDGVVAALALTTAARLDAFRAAHAASAEAGRDTATFAEAAADMRSVLPRLVWNTAQRSGWTDAARVWLEPTTTAVEEALGARNAATVRSAAPDTDEETAAAIAGLPSGFVEGLALDMVLELDGDARLIIGSLMEDGDTYVLVLCRLKRDVCKLSRFILASLIEGNAVWEKVRSARETIKAFYRGAGETVADARAALAINREEREWYKRETRILNPGPLPVVKDRHFVEPRARVAVLGLDPWSDQVEASSSKVGRSDEGWNYEDDVPAKGVAEWKEEKRGGGRGSEAGPAQWDMGAGWAPREDERQEFAEESQSEYAEALSAVLGSGQPGRSTDGDYIAALSDLETKEGERKARVEEARNPRAEVERRRHRAESRAREAVGSNFVLTCDPLNAGVYVCVEYTYEREKEYVAARNKCLAAGYKARSDASCPRGRGAFVCLHTTDGSRAHTYSYPVTTRTSLSETKARFIAQCKGTRGTYMGTR